MRLLLVPLFVSAVFFLGVFLRDLRGDFRERTHYFEDLDPWEGPSPASALPGGLEVATPRRHQARDFIQQNLAWWLAVPASVSVAVSLVLTAAIGMLSGHVVRPERHWSEPRLTLMVIPFKAVGEGASQKFVAVLDEGLKRELASWNGLDLIRAESASLAQRQAAEADQRGDRLRPRYALEGSVLRSTEVVSIQARLFDARTATDVWSAQLKADPANRSKLFDELTSGIAGALDAELAR